MTTEKVKKILIVGQTPPPFHGQAIMIQRTVEAPFKKVKIYHLRMSFSKDVSEVAKFKLYKVYHLFELVLKTITLKFRHNISTLYYVPGGHKSVPLIRDIVFLSLTRIFFKNTVFHFRAGGVFDHILGLSYILRRIALNVYSNPAATIHLTKRNLDYQKFNYLNEKQIVIPNGAPDFNASASSGSMESNSIACSPKNNRILYVGMLTRSKGVSDLIEAAAILGKRGIQFNVQFVGGFDSEEYRREVQSIVEEYKLVDKVIFHGVKIGGDKFEIYKTCDIFCFPSYFDAEAFPNVILEAMMFGLPVVSTKHAGIPDIVDDEKTGYLVDIKSPLQVADKLEILLADHDLAIKLGKCGRERFVSNYTIDKYYQRMEEFLYSI